MIICSITLLPALVALSNPIASEQLIAMHVPETTLAINDVYPSKEINSPNLNNLNADKLGLNNLSLEKMASKLSASSFHSPSIKFTTGTQSAAFRWSIAGSLYIPENSTIPNVLSELSHRDLRIHQSAVTVQWYAPQAEQGLVIESYAAFGTVSSGTIQDSDYDGRDRSEEYSRSYSDPDGSTTRNFSTSIGWQTRINRQLMMAGHVGYALNEQNFVIRDGEQALTTNGRTPDSGALNGLDSRYNSEWQGFWSGIHLNFQQNQDEQFNIRLEHHWADFYADADWNLRQDFAHPRSFEQFAQGIGMIFRATYDRKVTDRLSLNISASKESWNTGEGLDRLFYADGRTAITRLNEAMWEASGFHIGIQYRQ